MSPRLQADVLARQPLVALVGPTAAGKTEAAIALAQRLDMEVVSADSRLFYRGMDIGTAKPGIEERGGVPHHLIDVADPHQTWSLADFQQAAGEAIAGSYQRGRLPLLVGGTGQYVRAVLEGWQAPHTGPDLRLRAALEALAERVTPAGLHARLAGMDPPAAQSIDPRNLRRTVRALEVILSTGRRFSEQRKRGDSPYQVLMLGLQRDRRELYARIDARIQAMLEAGFKEEVAGLLRAGYSPDSPALSAIGYREMAAHLRGENTLDEAVVLMKRQTRIFVRRQGNWFKRDDPRIQWVEAGPGPVDARVIEALESAVRRWLETLEAQ